MASATYTLELTRDWTCLEAHGRDLAGLPRHITSGSLLGRTNSTTNESRGTQVCLKVPQSRGKPTSSPVNLAWPLIRALGLGARRLPVREL